MGTDLQSYELELDGDDSIAASLEDYLTMARGEMPAGLSPLLEKAVEQLRRDTMNNEVEAYPGELAELRSRVDNFSRAEKKIAEAVIRCQEHFDAEQLGGIRMHKPGEILDVLEDGAIASWLAGLQKRNIARFRRFPVKK